ncbi:MAG TPA: hypothetical protein VIC54_07770 [Terriglobales bacterium]|jgi:hypothetical protein
MEMSMRKLLVAVFCLAVSGVLFLPKARADQWNKKTTLTFSQPVEVPGMILPAGTYVFVLVDSMADRNIVRIFNADETHVFATILAINNYRLVPTDKTVITFEERPVDTPVALHAWFYPGDQYGQEFVYPKSDALALAKLNKAPVLAMPTELASNLTESSEAGLAALKEAPIVAVEPTGEEVPATEVVAVSPSTQVADATPPSLPKTAGELPLFGALGLLLLGVGVSMLVLVKRSA